MNGNRQLRWTPAIEQAAYFSCLEALQNAIKHGDARRIMITISGTPGVLDFEVGDDGRGFDPALLGSGSGTANLADRIAAVGGRLEITTGPGLGTTIRGSIPMHDGPVSQPSLDSPASLVAAP
jgi:signal transduction histidine kinase